MEKFNRKIVHEDFCYSCKCGGELVMCDICPKVFHTDCIVGYDFTKYHGGVKNTSGENDEEQSWICPWHHCSYCSKTFLTINESNTGVLWDQDIHSYICCACTLALCHGCAQNNKHIIDVNNVKYPALALVKDLKKKGFLPPVDCTLYVCKVCENNDDSLQDIYGRNLSIRESTYDRLYSEKGDTNPNAAPTVKSSSGRYISLFKQAEVELCKTLPVDCFAIEHNQEHLKRFPSEVEAANYVQGLPIEVRETCRGKRRSARGYVWRYANSKVSELMSRLENEDPEVLDEHGNIKNLSEYTTLTPETFKVNNYSHRDFVTFREVGKLKYDTLKKQVDVYSLSGVFLKRFESGSEASRFFRKEISQSTISACCYKRLKGTNGFTFQFSSLEVDPANFPTLSYEEVMQRQELQSQHQRGRGFQSTVNLYPVLNESGEEITRITKKVQESKVIECWNEDDFLNLQTKPAKPLCRFQTANDAALFLGMKSSGAGAILNICNRKSGLYRTKLWRYYKEPVPTQTDGDAEGDGEAENMVIETEEDAELDRSAPIPTSTELLSAEYNYNGQVPYVTSEYVAAHKSELVVEDESDNDGGDSAPSARRKRRTVLDNLIESTIHSSNDDEIIGYDLPQCVELVQYDTETQNVIAVLGQFPNANDAALELQLNVKDIVDNLIGTTLTYKQTSYGWRQNNQSSADFTLPDISSIQSTLQNATPFSLNHVVQCVNGVNHRIMKIFVNEENINIFYPIKDDELPALALDTDASYGGYTWRKVLASSISAKLPVYNKNTLNRYDLRTHVLYPYEVAFSAPAVKSIDHLDVLIVCYSLIDGNLLRKFHSCHHAALFINSNDAMSESVDVLTMCIYQACVGYSCNKTGNIYAGFGWKFEKVTPEAFSFNWDEYISGKDIFEQHRCIPQDINNEQALTSKPYNPTTFKKYIKEWAKREVYGIRTANLSVDAAEVKPDVDATVIFSETAIPGSEILSHRLLNVTGGSIPANPKSNVSENWGVDSSSDDDSDTNRVITVGGNNSGNLQNRVGVLDMQTGRVAKVFKTVALASLTTGVSEADIIKRAKLANRLPNVLGFQFLIKKKGEYQSLQYYDDTNSAKFVRSMSGIMAGGQRSSEYPGKKRGRPFGYRKSDYYSSSHRRKSDEHNYDDDDDDDIDDIEDAIDENEEENETKKVSTLAGSKRFISTTGGGFEMDVDPPAADYKPPASREQLIQEGWVFDRADKYLGAKCRRFFWGDEQNLIISNGEVIGYLAPHLNDGIELYRFKHEDGDEEDFEYFEVMKFMSYHALDIQDDPDDRDDADKRNGDSNKRRRRLKDVAKRVEVFSAETDYVLYRFDNCEVASSLLKHIITPTQIITYCKESSNNYFFDNHAKGVKWRFSPTVSSSAVIPTSLEELSLLIQQGRYPPTALINLTDALTLYLSFL